VAISEEGDRGIVKTIVEIPDECLPELEAYKDRLGELLLLGLSQIKIQEAILLYQRGVVSLGRAAELAGLTEQKMARHARAFGVSPRWDERMLEEELV
jgi:predicted HTH domain antitoxin